MKKTVCILLLICMLCFIGACEKEPSVKVTPTATSESFSDPTATPAVPDSTPSPVFEEDATEINVSSSQNNQDEPPLITPSPTQKKPVQNTPVPTKIPVDDLATMPPPFEDNNSNTGSGNNNYGPDPSTWCGPDPETMLP